MRLYKLTDENMETLGNTKWGENVTHKATGDGTTICSDGWIHAYTSPLLATLMNPVHGDFINPICWEAEGEIGITDGTKVGCKQLTTIRMVELPEVSRVQRIAFGILVSLEVYEEAEFVAWANKWLSGEDRSRIAAYVTANAVVANAVAAYAANAAANTDSFAAFAANAAAANAANLNFEQLAQKAMEIK